MTRTSTATHLLRASRPWTDIAIDLDSRAPLHARAVSLHAFSLHLAAALLIGAACALAISTYKYFSHTWDEPEHIAAGMQLIDKGTYTYDVQHPPLARLAMALGPYLAGARSFGEPGPSGEQEGRDLLYRTGRYDQLLTLARLGVLPFLIILLSATWLWARRYFGLAEAALAVFFLATTPPIIGHAAVAALDIPGAALCTLALYSLLRWFGTRSWPIALAAGLACGLAIATKLSNLPFLAIVGVLWMLTVFLGARKPAADAGWNEPIDRRWWAQAAGIAVLALACAVFCYGFGFEYAVSDRHPYNAALSRLFGESGWAHDVSYAIARHVPLPAGLARLTSSIEALAEHNREGHLSYLLGQFSKTGFRSFYVVALAVKTPLPLLLFGSAGLVFVGWRARRLGWIVAAPTIAFLALLAFCSFYSHINIGVRHVFVLYPLLAIAAGAFALYLWRRYTHRTVRAALLLMLTLQAFSLWTAYPDYLPYFNPLAGSRPERILIDSDLDWGQDLKRLKTRLDELHVTRFGFVYRGSADVIGERLPGVWMAQPFEPATGWIAASVYARDTVLQGQAFAWLKDYKPVERIGKSIDLYFIADPAEPGKRER